MSVDERENEQPGDLRSIVKRRRIRGDQMNEQFADVISEVLLTCSDSSTE